MSTPVGWCFKRMKHLSTVECIDSVIASLRHSKLSEGSFVFVLRHRSHCTRRKHIEEQQSFLDLSQETTPMGLRSLSRFFRSAFGAEQDNLSNDKVTCHP